MLGLLARNFLHGYKSCAQLDKIKQQLEVERPSSLTIMDGHAWDYMGGRRGGE